jgi:adenylate cyclase
MISEMDILHAKVLIVDDQKSNILLLERILRGAGYASISSTVVPQEVCGLHRDSRYDLILLDLQMPGMSGFEVMEGLKEIETGDYLPVLVITAQPDHKLRALQSGAKDFVSKPFDHAEVLARVRNMLEVRLLHQETKNLYAQVLAEQRVSERLLLNVLPQTIAERLKAHGGINAASLLDVVGDDFLPLIADSDPDVTVLFADIVGFTRLCSDVAPQRLVVLLNEIFTGFDSIADKRGLEKIKTIGDAYMAVAGIPSAAVDHVSRAAHMALDMLDSLSGFNQRNGYRLQMRIGIDTGAVVAGVIGKRKFIYDLWGETVNTASRMESCSLPGRIQMTDSTRQRLSETFTVQSRGNIDVEGKGAMHTWFLNGRNVLSAGAGQVSLAA